MALLRTGNIIRSIGDEGDRIDSLPPKIYIVKQDESGYYLEIFKDSYNSLPKQVYGTATDRVKKVVFAYKKLKQVAVLTTGLKGSGKTLLGQLISNHMLEHEKMPVVVVQSPYKDIAFLKFMSDLGKAVIMFDEFGKTYPNMQDQNKLLGLFDGLFSGDRLIILTENEVRDISNLYINRPSRVLYYWNYSRIEEEVVFGYLKDNITNKKHIKDIKEIYGSTESFTFDNLQAIVAQCNLYPKLTVADIMDGLNVDIGAVANYIITDLKMDGVDTSGPYIKPEGGDNLSLRFNAEGSRGIQSLTANLNTRTLDKYQDGVLTHSLQYYFESKERTLTCSFKLDSVTNAASASSSSNRSSGFRF